jgi:hypothetical protein
MVAAYESPLDSRQKAADLYTRHAVLQRAMIQSLERTAARENYWLIYILVGWEHLAACVATYYLVEILGLQRPYRYPYLVVWLLWVLVAWGTIRLVRGHSASPSSPLVAQIKRTWTMFFLLCGNVIGLNVTAGLPVLVFLPVMATLGTFAFSFLAVVLSRKFLAASLVMFVTSLLIAWFPACGFLIYGGSWLLVLHVLGLILLRNKRFLDASLAGDPLAKPPLARKARHMKVEEMFETQAENK